MGFWDFLKGILPENININVDNRKIEISNSTVKIGEKIIADSNIVDSIFAELSKYSDKDSLPAQIIHQDLEKSFSDYEQVMCDQNTFLHKLRDLLPSEDIMCILMAWRVKLAYDKSDSDLAKDLHKTLTDQFPEKGSKVYCLINGGYFNELIIPFIDIFKVEYGKEYTEEFRKFYFNIIKFFPLAFFVGNFTSKEEIIINLNQRLKLSVPFIRLHSIGESNIQKVDDVVKELQIKNKYSIEDRRFTSPTGIKAQIFEIKLSKEK